MNAEGGQIAEVQLADESVIRCFSPPGLAIHAGDNCVLDAERAPEYGRIFRMLGASDEPVDAELPVLLRRATLQDKSKAKENALRSKMARDSCERKVAELKLKMSLVQVRFSFDRSLLSVTFVADDRVDFRELVKSLSNELSARIDMRQIGVRDAAGIVGGLGPCGREMCCTWLRHFETINVKMAKNQRLSLNPASISGMCGRLKCCLRYENECYSSLRARLPRDGALVECPAGRGRVLDSHILAQTVVVRTEDSRVITCSLSEVKVLPK